MDKSEPRKLLKTRNTEFGRAIAVIQGMEDNTMNFKQKAYTNEALRQMANSEASSRAEREFAYAEMTRRIQMAHDRKR